MFLQVSAVACACGVVAPVTNAVDFATIDLLARGATIDLLQSLHFSSIRPASHCCEPPKGFAFHGDRCEGVRYSSWETVHPKCRMRWHLIRHLRVLLTIPLLAATVAILHVLIPCCTTKHYSPVYFCNIMRQCTAYCKTAYTTIACGMSCQWA